MVKIFHDASLLNKKGYHGIAAIACKVEQSTYGQPGVEGSINISSCNRSIELDLYATDLGEYENNIHKVCVIRDMMDSLLYELKYYKPTFQKQVEEYKKKNESEKASATMPQHLTELPSE